LICLAVLSIPVRGKGDRRIFEVESALEKAVIYNEALATAATLENGLHAPSCLSVAPA
jgi:hypothetical protein